MTDDQQAWLDECPVGEARTMRCKVGDKEIARTVDRRVVFSPGVDMRYITPAAPIVVGRGVAPLAVGPVPDPLPGTIMCGAPPSWRA